MPLGGVNALSDPVHVLPGKLLRLQNARFDQPGGISKRVGYSLRSAQIFSDAVSLVTSGVRLAEMPDGEQLLFDERKVYAWEEHASVQQWVDRGRPGDVQITSELVNFDQSSNLHHFDIAQAPNGIRLVCWLPVADGSANPAFNYFVSIGDTVLVKGATPSPNEFDSVLIQPFVIGAEIWALSPQNLGAGAGIRWAFIDSIDDDPSELTFTPAAFAAPSLATNFWDHTKGVAGTVASRFAVLYSDSTDLDQLHVSYRNSTTQAEVWNHDSGIVATEVYCTALLAVDNRVWVARGVGNDIRLYLINETTGATITGDTSLAAAGSDVVRIGLCRFDANNILVCWEQRKGSTATPPSARLPYIRWAIVNTSLAAVGGIIRTCSDVAIIGKPYEHDGLFYLPIMHTGESYGHGFVVQIADAAVTSAAQVQTWRATFARDITTADGLDNENDAVQIDLSGNVPSRGHVPNIPVVDAFGGRALPIRSAERFEVAKANDDPLIIRHCGVRLITIFHQTSSRNWATWGAGMFITSARPSWYDGVQIGEHGFAWQPSVDRDTPSDFIVDPTGVLTAGAYQAAVIFQYQDVNGQIHQSEPSATMGPVTAAANDEGHVVLKNTLLTDRAPANVSTTWSTGASRPRALVYRTTVGPGAVMFRAQQFYFGAEIFPNELTTPATPPSTQIDFAAVVEESDTSIQNNEVLYTTGGILPNTGTPPAEVCHVHGGRLWLAQLEDQHDVWFSQPFVASEAPRLNGNLKLRFDEPVFSLGTLDDKLIVGTARNLYVVTGNGPPAAGDIDIGFQIERLASDVGCIDHRSMVQTPMGLMFFSAGRGFMLLDRSLQLQEIGAPVRQFLFGNRLVGTLTPALAPIRCGTLVADQTLVRWLANATISASDYPVWFVYDYRVGEWSIDTTDNTGFGADSLAFGGSAYAYLTLDGVVFDEDKAQPGDAGAFISMAMETPWIRLDTLQGWQRVRSVTVLGRRSADPASLTIAIGYDYEDAYTQTVTFTAAQITALPTDVLQFKVRFGRQKCEAFRIAINDGQLDEGDGYDGGLRISSLVFEAGLKRGTMKLKQEQKA